MQPASSQNAAKVGDYVGSTWPLLLQKADIPSPSFPQPSWCCQHRSVVKDNTRHSWNYVADDVVGGYLCWVLAGCRQTCPALLLQVLRDVFPPTYVLLSQYAKPALRPNYSHKARKRSLQIHALSTMLLNSAVLWLDILSAWRFFSTLIPSGRNMEWRTLVAKDGSCFLWTA